MRVRRIAAMLLTGTMFLFTGLTGQVSEPGQPYGTGQSALKSAAALPLFSLQPVYPGELVARDAAENIHNRYSVFEEISVDLRKEAASVRLEQEKTTVWHYRISGNNAFSLQVQFSEFMVPDGARLFIYNDRQTEVLGAFTSRNNRADKTLMIADFPGEELILEYSEPDTCAFPGRLVIGAVGKAYRNMLKSGYNVDENGYINVNCSEGAPWQDEKHAVLRYSFREGDNGYVCSGALINNVRNDGTPYFLTASHCLNTETTASTVVARFNYEQIGCDGPLKEWTTISGATLLATAEASDYTLLLFLDDPLEEQQPYFAGWDVSGDPGENHAGIHHPGGGTKKISIADSAAVNYEYEINWEGNSVSPPNSHWVVNFVAGITTGGSSGSPLFNGDGRIIGQLHGGSIEDYYGRLDYSWDTPSETDTLLKFYLDPDGTDTLAIDSYYPAGVLPDPLFVPQFEQACNDAPLEIFGYSAFDPLSWSWSFDPDNVTFLEGTGTTSRNPVISLRENTTYDVTLQVTNEAGNSVQAFAEGISTAGGLVVSAFPKSLTDSCLCTFDSMLIAANGATLFNWTMDPALDDYFVIVPDSDNTAWLKMVQRPDSAVTVEIAVTGFHGTCSDELTFMLPLFMPENDSAQNAVELFTGDNGPFSNKCAGIEENEPIPPVTSCTGQFSWCDEYGTGEDIIENSLWFYFIPQDTGFYRIGSTGMDNQIAIYEADTLPDLFTGNYTLIGANDDITSTNYNAVLERVLLNAGQTYWIQADGSAGGSVGKFGLGIQLLELLGKTDRLANTDLIIYPQPSDDIVLITWENMDGAGLAAVEIYDLTGSKVFSTKIETDAKPEIRIPVSHWSRGTYFVRCTQGNMVYQGKLIR